MQEKIVCKFLDFLRTIRKPSEGHLRAITVPRCDEFGSLMTRLQEAGDLDYLEWLPVGCFV